MKKAKIRQTSIYEFCDNGLSFDDMAKMSREELRGYIQDKLGERVPKDFTRASCELMIALRIGVRR